MLSTSTIITAASQSEQYDWLWAFALLPVLLLLALWVASVISILKSKFHWSIKLLCIIATFSAPIIGPLVWFIFARDTDTPYSAAGESPNG